MFIERIALPCRLPLRPIEAIDIEPHPGRIVLEGLTACWGQSRLGAFGAMVSAGIRPHKSRQLTSEIRSFFSHHLVSSCNSAVLEDRSEQRLLGLCCEARVVG